MRGAALLILVAAGCVEPDLLTCGDQLCNSDQVCYANSRCVSPDQLAQCADADDGTACTAPVEGHCIAHVCEPATCGDGFVDDDVRESCEPGLLSPQHCVDLGFDEGRPGCTDACEADVTDGCVRYGWTRFLNAPTTTFVTDGTTSFWLTSAGLYSQAPDGTITLLWDGPAAALKSNGGRVVLQAFRDTRYRLYDVTTTGVTEVYAGNTITSLSTFEIDDGGVIYTATVPVGGMPTIGILGVDGAISEVATTPQLNRFALGAGTNPRIFFVPASDSDELWEIDRAIATGAYVHTFSDQITEIREEPTTHSIWVGTLSGLFTIDGPFFAQLDSSATLGVTTITPLGEFVYVADINGGVSRYAAAGNGSLRMASRFTTPSGNRLTTDGTAIYSYGGPVYRFTGRDWSTRAPLQTASSDAFVRSDGQVYMLTDTLLYTPRTDGRAYIATRLDFEIPPRAIASEGSLSFISTYEADGTSPHLMRSTTTITGLYKEVVMADPPVLRSLWRDPSSDLLLAVGDLGTGGVLGTLRGTAWEPTLVPGCTVRAVRNAIAVGGCGGQPAVWRYNGATWDALTPPPLAGVLASVAAPSDGSIAVASANGAAVFDGTSWFVDESAVGDWIAGTSRTDFYISGDFTDVQHYNGVYWSRLAVSQATPIKVVATPHAVTFAGAIGGFTELVR